ncbi:MAG TPA: HEAT repeat domain-containing protein, partial [Planctomycetota bacterium]|nr:HEAT repeat domain-containing protein [Planctomycetota bacterium]
VQGGANERKQAALSLAAQTLENSVARAKGEAEPWPAPPDFTARLQRAWDELPVDEDPHLRLVLAQLSAQQGEPGALDKLGAVLDTPDAEDPEGEVRAYAMLATTWLEDERAAELLIPFLDHADPFLRQSAAGVLQRVPGEAAREALRGLLGDASLELRGQAAISLATLGDPSGAHVLRELVDPATYGASELRESGKFQGERSVHDARLEGLLALARLGLAEDRALFERLAADDPDHGVREAAMRALAAASVDADASTGGAAD